MTDYKKIAAGITGVILAVSTIAVSISDIQENFASECTVWAEEIKLSDGLVIEQENGEIIITGCDKSVTSVQIGDKLDEYHIVSIKDGAFSGCDKLTKIDMIEGYITSIGKNTFNECVNLSEIIIPDSVKSIDDIAFEKCEKIQIKCNPGSCAEKYAKENNIPFSYLEKSEPIIEFPENTGCTDDGLIYEIRDGKAAIIGLNEKSTEVTIPEEIEGCPVISMKHLQSENLAKITVSDNLELVDGDLFKEFRNLTQINASCASKKYSSVDGVLFNKDKTALICYPMGKKDTSYSIPEGVTNIGNMAFTICNNLSKIIIPDGVIGIGEGSFSSCDSLRSITLPKSLKVIGKDAFRFCGITEIDIPDGVEYIEENTFFNCRNLKKVTLPDSIKSIGDSAFSACTCNDFTDITIPENVTEIGQRAFLGCINLKKIVIPQGVKSINESTFFNCVSLSEITLPDSLNTIEKNAFDHCISLESITFPAAVCAVDNRVFNNCENLTDIKVSEKNQKYTSVDGVLFNKDKTSLCCYPAGKKETSYSVPQGVISICNCAFMSCDAITEIKLPDSITEISEYAFERCKNLSRINIPAKVECIGKYTFSDCISVKEISVPEGVKEIKDSAFAGCSSLIKITLPDSLTQISDLAFDHSNTDYVIYGKSGSYAEKFAAKYHIDFVAADRKSGKAKSGDINGDEKISVWDFVMIKQYVTGAITLNEGEKNAADTNGDGKVNIFDCIRIRRMIL